MPMEDCQAVLDSLEGSKLLSAIDVKAAFNNIPQPQEIERFTGIITQDGIYTYQVMAWGFNAAPCHYQHVMNRVMNTPHPVIPIPFNGVYLDDITVGGQHITETWNHTLAGLWRIAISGQPINLWKCHFLVRKLNLLGVVLSESSYAVGKKALAKLLDCQPPRTLK